MKKAISFMLALSAVFALCISVNATSVTTDGGTGSATLTYNVEPSFTVTIPASVTLTGGTETSTISVADAIIPTGESLTVSITAAANYDAVNSTFRLRNGSSDCYASYTVMNGETPVELNAPFLTVAAGTLTGSAALTYTAGNVTTAGSFTDTLTFTVTHS